jgi:magnesium-transporting ATPase (P-type)
MIEVYAFFAAFTVQIVAMSVLLPAWISKYFRARATEFPAERFKQLYPGVDHHATFERYLKWYRVLNTVIALLGLLLLGWLFSHMRRADYNHGAGEVLRLAYSMLQLLPLCIACFPATRYSKLLKQLLEGKRTAILKRRGLFDFVSPFTVFLAVLTYFLYVAYVLYIAQHPFPGFAGPLINIVAITLIYAVNSFVVYKTLYGRKSPLQTHAARMYTIGLVVKACVYISILIAVSLSLSFTIKLLDLQSWEPFAGSVHFVFFAFLLSMMFTVPPRRPEADGLGASSAS